MHVQLIFPPQWLPHMPYLSVPSLTAYLEERGVDCRQRDLNLESYDRFLSPIRLERYGKVILDRIAAIEADKRIGRETAELHEALCSTALRLPLVLDRIEEAKSVLRSPTEFYRLDRHTWAYRCLNQVFSIISLAHHPCQLTFWEFLTQLDPTSLEGLEQSTMQGDQNPYLSLFEEEFVPEILQDAPDILGISVIADCQLIPTFTLINALRRRAPDLFVVLGGPFFSKLEQTLLESPELFQQVNAYVMRDGEEPLYRLCRTLEEGGRLGDVPNLVYRDDDGAVRQSAERVTSSITDLPTPSFSGLPLDYYFSGESVLPLLTSRGCYWNKCRFCSSFHVYGHRFRQRGAEKVLEDMNTLHRRHGCRHFHFSDEALPPAQSRRIATEIIEQKLPYRWFGEARFEKSFDRDLCATLAAGGCMKIKFGLESGSQKVLDLMCKGTDLDVARDVVAACHESGIAIHYFCMVGFPGETETDSELTRRFLLDRPDVLQNPGFSFYCNGFVLEVGSEAALNPAVLGIENIRRAEGEVLNLLLEFDAPNRPSPDTLERWRWELIRTVSEAIGPTRVPDEESQGFLYLAHFNGQPPAPLAEHAGRPAELQLPPGARPCPAPGLITRRTRVYRPESPAAIPAHQLTADDSPIWLASTPRAFQCTPLDRDTMGIIRLCDGQHSWEEIARHTATPEGEKRAEPLPYGRVLIIEQLLALGILVLDGETSPAECP